MPVDEDLFRKWFGCCDASSQRAIPQPWPHYYDQPGGYPVDAVLQQRAEHRHCCPPLGRQLSVGCQATAAQQWAIVWAQSRVEENLLLGGSPGDAAAAGTGGPCGSRGALPAAGIRNTRWAGETRCCSPRVLRRDTAMAIGQVPLALPSSADGRYPTVNSCLGPWSSVSTRTHRLQCPSNSGSNNRIALSTSGIRVAFAPNSRSWRPSGKALWTSTRDCVASRR